jgi:hypothetical protein
MNRIFYIEDNKTCYPKTSPLGQTQYNSIKISNRNFYCDKIKNVKQKISNGRNFDIRCSLSNRIMKLSKANF